MRIVWFLLLFTFLTCCKSSDENLLKDSRDNIEYPVMETTGADWMALNCSYLDKSIYNSGAWIWGDDKSSYEEVKKDWKPDDCVLYNWSTARICCPDGWRLPSKAEWAELIEERSIYGNGTVDFSGFNLLLDGHGMSMGRFCIYDGDTFWTNDRKSGDPTVGISVAIRISEDGKIICTYEEADIENAYYVRCVEEGNNTHE